MTHEFHSYYYDQMQREPVTEDFLIPAETVMDATLLRELIDEHREQHLPRYEYLDAVYDAHYAIFGELKHPKPEHKPDNRLAADFVYTIIQTFEGYFIGIPVDVKAEDEQDGEYLNKYFKRNHQEDVDAELSKMASKFGHAYEMFYQDNEGEPRSAAVSPMTAFMVYDDSVLKRPKYFVRYLYDDDGIMKGSYSDDSNVYSFSEKEGTLTIDEPTDDSEHSFGMVPAIDFIQNSEKRGLCEGVLSLIEAYNQALSEKANDVEYFSDAILVIQGTELPDDFKKDLNELRLINLYGDESSSMNAFYLAKPDSDGMQENFLNRLEMLIFKTAMVPDITNEQFSTASGIALKMRLMPMSNLARNKERKFKMGIERRLELLANYPSEPFSGDDWMHVEITMHRNMPEDIASEASVAGSLSGIVSEETQLGILSCVDDPKAEIERKQKEQQAKVENYSDGMPTERTKTSREPSMYEITSILDKRRRKAITYNNAVAMLVRIGLDEETARKYLDDTDVEEEENEA